MKIEGYIKKKNRNVIPKSLEEMFCLTRILINTIEYLKYSVLKSYLAPTPSLSKGIDRQRGFACCVTQPWLTGKLLWEFLTVKCSHLGNFLQL